MHSHNQQPTRPVRIIVGISGASGAVYGVRALELLHNLNIETHLIMTRSAALTLHQEMDLRPADLTDKATVVHNVNDIGASVSSGSFVTDGMLIAPCSIRTLSEIATGTTSTLLTRAADVILKERRRLVLMVRETPLHIGHLRSLVAVSEAGAIIAPPVPAFYTRPRNIDDIVNHSVGRALDLFGIDANSVQRWAGMKA